MREVSIGEFAFSIRVRILNTTGTSMEDGDSEIRMDVIENQDDEDAGGPAQTYLPGQPLEEGEELVCDDSAYPMYHQAHTGGFFLNLSTSIDFPKSFRLGKHLKATIIASFSYNSFKWLANRHWKTCSSDVL